MSDAEDSVPWKRQRGDDDEDDSDGEASVPPQAPVPMPAPVAAPPPTAAAAVSAGGSGLCAALRGLPWNTAPEDVAAFFAGALPGLSPASCLVLHNPTGEALVALRSASEVAAALTRNKAAFGKRWVRLLRTEGRG